MMVHSSPPINIWKVRGHKKGTVNGGERYVRMANFFLETMDELSTTLYVPQDVYQRLMLHPHLHHCLKNNQLSVIRIQQKECLVLCTVT